MAIETDVEDTGLRERTGIAQFMVKKILDGELHRAFHNCEPVYWLCSIALLFEHAASVLKVTVEGITNSLTGLHAIYMAKTSFVASMISCNRRKVG